MSAEAARHASLGRVLFAVYLSFYGAFVLVSAFRPAWMEILPFAGVNLAVLWGLGLIAGAFVLALAYAWLCRSRGDAR